MKALFGLIGLLLLILLVLSMIILGAQNSQLITLNYLIAQSEMSLSTLMACMILLGFALGSLFYLLFWAKLRWQLGKLKRLQQQSGN